MASSFGRSSNTGGMMNSMGRSGASAKGRSGKGLSGAFGQTMGNPNYQSTVQMNFRGQDKQSH